jgi:hypothetical protein
MANAILDLRRQELAKATRVFNARGSKVIRCDACLLPQTDCICAAQPQPVARAAFCFIMYTGECYKPSNTGRLICEVAADNHAFVWDRTQPDPRMLALLANPAYAPIVVFPEQYAAPERCLSHADALAAATAGRIPLFVMLDGTWREAKWYGECRPIRRSFGDSIRPNGPSKRRRGSQQQHWCQGHQKGEASIAGQSQLSNHLAEARNQANGLAVRPSLHARLGCESKKGKCGKENATLHDLKAPTAQSCGSADGPCAKPSLKSSRHRDCAEPCRRHVAFFQLVARPLLKLKT